MRLETHVFYNQETIFFLKLSFLRSLKVNNNNNNNNKISSCLQKGFKFIFVRPKCLGPCFQVGDLDEAPSYGLAQPWPLWPFLSSMLKDSFIFIEKKFITVLLYEKMIGPAL